uniref:Uncharacterized protein n=1 Tax=Anguilla anguilla TaxID=7936 RepID=A0A0E9VIM6_ANGAN
MTTASSKRNGTFFCSFYLFPILHLNIAGYHILEMALDPITVDLRSNLFITYIST